MTRSIYKYALLASPTEELIPLYLPKEAQILSVQPQGGALCLWALVDAEAEPTELRTFVIYGTGFAVLKRAHIYIATIQQPPFVWHVFEVT